MAEQQTVKVRVLRAFLIRGERQETGSMLAIDRRLAQELAASNKVEVVKEAPPAPPAPPAQQPAAPAAEVEAPAARARRKEA